MKYDVVKRVALGRSAKLGDLYNVYEDKFIKGSIFLKPEIVDQCKITTDMKYDNKTTFSLEEKLSKRLEGLKIPPEQTLGLLCGLHDNDLKGYEDLVKWEKKSNKFIRGTLIFSVFSYQENLNFENQFDRSNDFIKLLKEGYLSKSSHVVSSVIWGGRIIVSIDCPVQFGRSLKKTSFLLKGFLKEFAYSIMDLSPLKEKIEEYRQLDFSVTISGDVENFPAIQIEKIEHLLENFSKLVEMVSTMSPRPLSFKMFPLLKIQDMKIPTLNDKPDRSGVTLYQVSAVENYFYEVNELFCDLIDFIDDIENNPASKLRPTYNKGKEIFEQKEELACKIIKQKVQLKYMISSDRSRTSHGNFSSWGIVDKLRDNLKISKIKEILKTYEDSRIGLKYLSELKRRNCLLLIDENDLKTRMKYVDEFFVLHYVTNTSHLFQSSEWKRNYDMFHDIIDLTESDGTLRVFAMEHEISLLANIWEKMGFKNKSKVHIVHYHLSNVMNNDCLSDRSDRLLILLSENSQKVKAPHSKSSTNSVFESSPTRVDEERNELENRTESENDELEYISEKSNDYAVKNETDSTCSVVYQREFGTAIKQKEWACSNYSSVTYNTTYKSNHENSIAYTTKQEHTYTYSASKENHSYYNESNVAPTPVVAVTHNNKQEHQRYTRDERKEGVLETDLDDVHENQISSESSSESPSECNNQNKSSGMSEVVQDPLGAESTNYHSGKNKRRSKKAKKGKAFKKSEKSVNEKKVDKKHFASKEPDKFGEIHNPYSTLFTEEQSVLKVEDIAATEQINDVCRAKPNEPYESDGINDKSNMVLLEIACPASLYNKCNLSDTHIFNCDICSKELHYGFDRNIYCENCGKAPATSFSFKCSHPSHEGDFFQFESGDDLLGMLEKLKQRDELNILILGETGVGKSTFINAFANYLNYGTIDEAEAAELIGLIPTSFTLSDENYDVIEVKFGEEDRNEANEEGASKTQSCKAYCFPCGEKMVRLIDTPGIGDTRGIDQDAKNFVNILSFISNYTNIHGILLLMKPNNSRLNIFFRFCIQELLKHLHKSASENIVFVFTNSKSTFYKPGDTFPPLRKLLGQLKDVQIPLNQETIYCLDNDAFRFLVALRNKVTFQEGDREEYSFSWDKSASECDRLLKHIDKLKPHCVKETLSINEARRLIVSLVQPLGDIVIVIHENLFYLNSQIESMQSSKNNLRKLQGNLYVPVVDAQFIPLREPRTVCQSENCIVMEGENKIDRICHDPCYLKNITPDVVNNQELRNCLVFKSEFCSTCGCSWREHIHQRYIMKKVYVKKMDKSAASEMQDWTKRKERAEEVKLELELQRSKYLDELDFVIKASAMFSHFLTSNSITHQPDSIMNYIDFLINKEKAKQSIGRSAADNVHFVAELEKVKTAYSKQIRSNQQNPNDCNAQAIEVHVSMLYALPMFGERFKCISEQHERAVAQEVASHSERVYVPKNGGRRFDFTK